MSSNDSFPSLPKPSIKVEDVVGYLLTLKMEGHQIFKDERQDNVFYFMLSEVYKIRISVNKTSGTGQVQLQAGESWVDVLDVSTCSQLRQATESFARRVFKGKWPCRPKSARLCEKTPASNFNRISSLIGAAKIAAVFDPYLDNSSLVTLNEICSFGNSEISTGVRLLGSAKKTRSATPKFTKAGVDAWLTQLSITGEARVLQSENEHRRFILTSDGQSLILGPSLNAIHRNEAIHIEPDTEDRAFFEKNWDSATPLL